jgi:hypothetical protein
MIENCLFFADRSLAARFQASMSAFQALAKDLTPSFSSSAETAAIEMPSASILAIDR